jgi:hypothetical protein
MRWSSQIQTGFHVYRLTWGTRSRNRPFRLRDCHPVPSSFPSGFVYRRLLLIAAPRPRKNCFFRFSLLPVRSPLLGESLLLSSPSGTEMFHFPEFASGTYVFSAGYGVITRRGFPHSDILGS